MRRARQSRAAAPTRAEVMAGLDPAQEVRRAGETAHARFAQQAAGPRDRPHLHGIATVRGTQRRQAEITAPADRLTLAAEERARGAYAQVVQRPAPGAAPVVAGRIQDPANANAAETERHTYRLGSSRPPSYPQEAAHLGQLASMQGMSNPEVFRQLQQTMLARPLAPMAEEDQRHLMTTANILGVSEQRRNPAMGFFSAQTIDQAAQPGSGLTPAQVFGRSETRDGKKRNAPGLLPASGTGATPAYREFEDALAAGRAPASDAASSIRARVTAQHAAMMETGHSPENVARMHAEGMPAADIVDAEHARMRSAAGRMAAMSSGQLPYDLRALKRPRTGSG